MRLNKGTGRVYGAKVKQIMETVADEGYYSAKDFREWPRESTMSLLNMLWHQGRLVRIRPGTPGNHGTPAVYRKA
jgi:hypothetical protein